jgi:hypothetical protein
MRDLRGTIQGRRNSRASHASALFYSRATFPSRREREIRDKDDEAGDILGTRGVCFYRRRGNRRAFRETQTKWSLVKQGEWPESHPLSQSRRTEPLSAFPGGRWGRLQVHNVKAKPRPARATVGPVQRKSDAHSRAQGRAAAYLNV